MTSLAGISFGIGGGGAGDAGVRALAKGVQVLEKVPEVDAAAAALLAAEHAIRRRAIPYAFEGKRVLVAMADPGDIASADEISVATGRPVTRVGCSTQIYTELLRAAYGTTAAQMAARLSGASDGDDLVNNLEAIEADDLHRMAEQPSLINLVNLLILEAIRARASDVHIEPFERKLAVKYRVDGYLIEQQSPPKQLQAAITSRIKIMAGMNIAERFAPQDGHISLRFEGRKIDIRVSTVPTLYGESVVMRILDKEAVTLDLATLGMREADRDSMQKLIDLPHGMVLVTGPTGSGKTTTLYAALTKLYDPSLKIITIEDPVEYELSGINQIPVNPKRGVTFADGLRSMLRQDPDVIMVGEIRDGDTAEISVRAALTGHLVFSTLHTNNAITAPGRLMDMGVEPFLLSSVLEGILAQRLGRRVCGACKQPAPIAEAVKHRLSRMELAMFTQKYGGQSGGQNGGQCWVGRGCDKCNNQGMRGRLGFYEVLLTTPGMRQTMARRASAIEMAKQVQPGFITMRRDGVMKAVSGETSIEEVLRATQDAEDAAEVLADGPGGPGGNGGHAVSNGGGH